jgi:hypothetical protein
MVAPSERRPRGSRCRLFRSPYVIAAFLLVVVAAILMLLEPPESNENESILESLYRISATYDSPAIDQAQGQPAYDQSNPLAIPPGKAQNLPSIRVEETLKQRNRKTKYGGKHDKKHLGGFTAYDTNGVSPRVWKLMIQEFGVKSLLDVGCGRGTSTTWFLTHGVDVLCAEGSHDAYEKTFLPDPVTQMVEHDFSRGPWWPEKTYDAAWAVEFLEHVNLQYHYNYVTAFRKAALVFVSTSRWGGWHHVEVHSDEWWIRKYELYGLRYDAILTKKVRDMAKVESKNKTAAMAPDGTPYNAQHVWLTMKVFTNPVVAALPEHAHLFPEFGCYDEEGNRRECGTGKNDVLEMPLDKSLYPLELTPEMDKEWEDLIRKNLAIIKAQEAT